MHRIFCIITLLLPLVAPVRAEDAGGSVEQNIKAMDTDGDGQVTVSEMRAWLEAHHGKGYQQALLDEMEIRAGLKSCGSPFTRSLY